MAEVFRKVRGEGLEHLDRRTFALQNPQAFAIRDSGAEAVTLSVRVQGSQPEDFPLDAPGEGLAERPVKRP
jgi:hypothetical protein